MKKATPNRFLTAGRPGVFKVKMSLGRAMKTTDLNGGLIGGFGTLGPASGESILQLNKASLSHKIQKILKKMLKLFFYVFNFGIR